MKKKKLEYPEDMRNVMITYMKTSSSGPYGLTKTKYRVTKRGFYSKLFGNFQVPPAWQYFNGVLLPHGWGGDKLTLDEVIDWKYCDD